MGDNAEKVSLESTEFGAICDAVMPLLRSLEYGALELDHAITPVIEQIIAARVATAKADALREAAQEMWAKANRNISSGQENNDGA